MVLKTYIAWCERSRLPILILNYTGQIVYDHKYYKYRLPISY